MNTIVTLCWNRIQCINRKVCYQRDCGVSQNLNGQVKWVQGILFRSWVAILEATCSRDVFTHIFLKRTLPCVPETGKAPISRQWLLPSSSTTSLLMGSCQDLNTQGNELGFPLLPNRTLRGEFTGVTLIVELNYRFFMFTHIFLPRLCVILLVLEKHDINMNIIILLAKINQKYEKIVENYSLKK